MKHARLAACAALLWAVGGLAQAAPVTYYFSGSFSFADGLLTALAGQTYSGRFEYDSAEAPIFSGLNFSQYRMQAGSLAAGATDGSGATSIRGRPNNETESLTNVVWNSNISSATLSGTGDYLFAAGASDSSGAWASVTTMHLILLDTSGTGAGLGTVLSPRPSPLPGITSWSDTEFSIFDAGGSRVAGALNCISSDSTACGATRVPEPSSLSLLGLALVGLNLARRYRRV